MKRNYFRNFQALIGVLFFGIASSVFGQYSGSGTFVKITSLVDLTDGYYVIVNSGDAFAMNNTHNGTFLDRTTVTPSSGTIVNPDASIVWKIQTDGTSKTIYNEGIAKYVSYTGSSNNVQIVDAVSADNQRWSFSYASDVFTVANVALPTRILQYNASSPRYACYTSAQQKLLLYKYQATTTGVFAPVFSPLGGLYHQAQQVSLSSATEGASIYYTLDGTDPDNTKTEYTSPFSVSSTTTVKAIAYKTGMDASSVASATYTFPTEVANIAALRAASPGFLRLTGEAFLTLQTTTRNAKYVQDATGAVLIDDASGVITSTFNLGDGISGLVGTTAIYNGMLQFTPLANPGVATSTGNVITPIEVALENLSSYEAKLVKVNGVTINELASGGNGTFILAKSYNLNGANNPVLRTQYALDYIGAALPTTAQDIVGVVLMFNATVQLVPRSLAEITTSVGTSVNTPSAKGIFVAGSQIFAEAKAGELIEVYTVAGQKIASFNATDGLNTLNVNAEGILLVKVADRIAKVIL
jgi:hypothetical protein